MINLFVIQASGRGHLNELFHLEKKSYLNKSDDWQMLKDTLQEIFESMAMVNYPYPTNYLAKLPGWPVKVCIFWIRAYFFPSLQIIHAKID